MTGLKTLARKLHAYAIVGLIRTCEYFMPHAVWGWMEAMARVNA
jgi:hypothetical protein